MLFTAPSFAFLFLPFSLLFYFIFGKKQKKRCILLISVVYYVFLNVKTPLNMICLPVLSLYAFLAARTARIYKKRIITLLLCVVPIIWLLGMRMLVYISPDDFVYPIGITLPSLASVSYIVDYTRNKEDSSGLIDMLSYICFFPLMVIGPFLKYKEFSRITSAEMIECSMRHLADGARLYVIGMIKRIAVGAVLIDGYQQIFAYSWESPSVVTVVLLLVLVYFGVFFSISGYYDMAVGISRMFGVNVPEINANPFTVATVGEYSKQLFGGIRNWVMDYMIAPIYQNSAREPSRIVKTVAYCFFTMMLVRFTPQMAVIAIPLIAFSIASVATRLDSAAGKKRVGLRVVFGMLTVFVMGAFWVIVTLGDSSILQYIAYADSSNAEYQTDMLLISFSYLKYLFVIVLGVCTVIPRTASAERMYERLPLRLRIAKDYLFMIIMLAVFVFTVLFFLPQYEIYNHLPFNYIVI